MSSEDLQQSQSKKFKIISLGLLVHLLLLLAVFDIYFSSPLDHGMKPIRSTTKAPAERIVLFVADGLRAEAIIDENVNQIPFLKSIIDGKGSWGVAHTRVPTESRPGHVALLAGIYEDPSAIFKGWQANPVTFDSVINQSSNAWCWGSPDILNVFNKNQSSHIRTYTYDAEMEDFGQINTGLLDEWVFERVQKFLENGVNNCRDCKEQGNMYFLHLLGLDTAGHGFKPHSNEYKDNIKLVDKNVIKISNLFNEVFKDNKTAFIFTADHGMTDWGSHGAGSAHETEVPIIAWGAGIRQNPHRFDMNQIDLAPLMSSLIGINFPINSLGIIPSNYLNVDDETLAEIHLANTMQLLETFNIKRLRTEANTLVYLPFNGLTTDLIADKLNSLQTLKTRKEFKVLIDECRKLMKTLITGVDYYHNYYQYPLLMSISIGFIGWILFLVASVVLDNQHHTYKSGKLDRCVVLMLNMVPVALCYAQNYPLSYYVYFSFPFVVFTLLVDLRILSYIFTALHPTRNIFSILIYLIGIELLVYGFFNRSSFSILLILIGLWVLRSGSFGKYANKRDKLLWLTLSIILSIFPLFPIMKTKFNVSMYLLGCAAWVVLFYELFNRLKSKVQIQYKIFYIQFFCLILASIYSISLEYQIITNSFVKYFSWILFLLPIVLIPLTSTCVAVRLLSTFFGFAPFYLLVSSNFEAIFSAIYVAILCNWLLIETKSFNASDSTNLIYYVNFNSYHSKPKISSDIFRRAFLFMVFIFIGFFGTGNIASLNSFDPMWVRAFLTVFSPFKMMGLILLKIIVPFMFTCCVFRAINSIGKENILQMFCIILMFSDLMVLQFLYLITNVGSWLEIGSSLSHFIIMEGFVTILLILYGLAHLLTTARYV